MSSTTTSSSITSGGRCGLNRTELKELNLLDKQFCVAVLPDGFTVCGDPYTKHAAAATVSPSLAPPPQQCSQCGEMRPIPFVFVACAGNPVAPHTHNYQPIAGFSISSTGTPSALFADVLEKLSKKMDVIENQNEKIEKKVDETKKQMDETSNKRRHITVSGIDTDSWLEILARGFNAVPHDWTDVLTAMLEPSSSSTTTSPSTACPPFPWTAANENQQVDAYTQYIRAHLKLPRNIHLKKAPPGLLDTKSPLLPFDVNGTTDLILVERASEAANLLASGVRVIIELKKDLSCAVTSHQRQAMLELIIADISSAFNPIAILTDLRDTFIFFWLDWDRKERLLAKHVHYLPAPSRDLAFCLLNRLIAEGSSDDDEMKTAASFLEQLPVPISKRRKLSMVPELPAMADDDDKDDEHDDDEGMHESRFIPDSRPEWRRPTMLEREGLPMVRRKLRAWIRATPMFQDLDHNRIHQLSPEHQSMYS